MPSPARDLQFPTGRTLRLDLNKGYWLHDPTEIQGFIQNANSLRNFDL